LRILVSNTSVLHQPIAIAFPWGKAETHFGLPFSNFARTMQLVLIVSKLP
jgi:hypothetical protein